MELSYGWTSSLAQGHKALPAQLALLVLPALPDQWAPPVHKVR